MQPTRTTSRENTAEASLHRPYSVLLPVGFTMRPPLPDARCALTAPFHPYPPMPWQRRAVYFLWHFPWGRPRRALPGTVFSWSPDFPLRKSAAAARSTGDRADVGCAPPKGQEINRRTAADYPCVSAGRRPRVRAISP